ncbi:FAD-binding molybdopterin dehydrogenase [Pseudomonas daroniae]|uniref:FAD-binding molybdopterin dehydrogenase n=1 Tax=Phytopseudomonas daroniae TaxID=2487519 RepID=A0A4Q9QM89_9GAMM|nr:MULTISPECIES: xanthine dehydrogenase family protein subunit M [Pseudomonas]TBU73276.1 FAD-binding molybdopterin dehydrogenase [Pseudomonas daroniae]TBU79790.1 FAD-binding molybdopterin dehydrogenase [Pseudomonas daroniae]TBU82491.1 FAD-binding molybdopterin dehydrogenase [Pseudomonas sp. FRB 228]TBU91796.1 FAD-binding molybdopterin dehydrogenase [Pseudomonas daroniae]
MTPFAYSKPLHVDEALGLAGPGSLFIAGGTNMVDLMKENLLRPQRLIDINALPLREVEPTEEGGLRIGALVSNADLAWHPEVERRYPLLSQALLSGASPQLRNMASVGGNLLQRTRCHYFYDSQTPCNKREPGSGCPARTGLNRYHALFGASEQCVAVHPSDLCVALAALDAQVLVAGTRGQRRIAFADFHRLPEDEPQRDTQLASDELVLAVELPAAGFAANSSYLKLRDRASFAFALVSVAAALDFDADGRIREARLALGGVAHKPWRRADVERSLAGQLPLAANFQAAADLMLQDARPLTHNAFKVELARRAIVRALTTAAGGIAP